MILKFLKKIELKNLSVPELEREKTKTQKALKSLENLQDQDRQIKHSEPTDPSKKEVKKPTRKQLEDYLDLIQEIEVKKNLPSS